jgi:hypothetical protein
MLTSVYFLSLSLGRSPPIIVVTVRFCAPLQCLLLRHKYVSNAGRIATRRMPGPGLGVSKAVPSLSASSSDELATSDVQCRTPRGERIGAALL